MFNSLNYRHKTKVHLNLPVWVFARYCFHTENWENMLCLERKVLKQKTRKSLYLQQKIHYFFSLKQQVNKYSEISFTVLLRALFSLRHWIYWVCEFWKAASENTPVGKTCGFQLGKGRACVFWCHWQQSQLRHSSSPSFLPLGLKVSLLSAGVTSRVWGYLMK